MAIEIDYRKGRLLELVWFHCRGKGSRGFIYLFCLGYVFLLSTNINKEWKWDGMLVIDLKGFIYLEVFCYF